jgi:hypothetical protein
MLQQEPRQSVSNTGEERKLTDKARTLRRPGCCFIVAALEEVAADQRALCALLAICSDDAVDAIIPHRLLIRRSII